MKQANNPTNQPLPGLDQLSAAVSEARATTDEREAALREGVSAALKRLRAYARDMEVGRGLMSRAC